MPCSIVRCRNQKFDCALHPRNRLNHRNRLFAMGNEAVQSFLRVMLQGRRREWDGRPEQQPPSTEARRNRGNSTEPHKTALQRSCSAAIGGEKQRAPRGRQIINRRPRKRAEPGETLGNRIHCFVFPCCFRCSRALPWMSVAVGCCRLLSVDVGGCRWMSISPTVQFPRPSKPYPLARSPTRNPEEPEMRRAA